MTGPKLTAMILFGALSFLFAFAFALGLAGGFGAFLTGVVAAVATCALIWFAETSKRAFARGFLALGAVFIVVPVASMAQWAERVGGASVEALASGAPVSSEQAGEFVVTSILASAGLVFVLIVGLLLVLIGGLMHGSGRNPPPLP